MRRGNIVGYAGKLEVEIVADGTTGGEVTDGPRTIMVQCIKRSLASHPAPKPKRPCLNIEAQLDKAHTKAAQLWLKKTELQKQNNKYQETLIDMHQHSQTQESELLHMSNHLYLLLHNWGSWEKEFGEIIGE
ncbi:uncharacterized protein F5147DRAFT_652090 [Suillus discolor]|uniref:Uncharacterized protein n=1 Tax=Suillus discolor TaxID=1912936 RepID=A0A9P7F7R9_9AGAM|nr:uncharacterized protein F5147DRAFT_652090 [Suillus discolor]KAG2109906.1 hypothetical protein F5147DRAFT_652090 [Suillus discolor]